MEKTHLNHSFGLIGTLNYFSWVTTDGIEADSQICLYSKTIQTASLMCTLQCILKSLYLVERVVVAFVFSLASGGIDSIINALLSRGY